MTRAEMDELRTAEVWPCCWPAVVVLLAMQTQWRSSGNGPIGLDYNALPFVLEMKGYPRERWPRLFDDVAVMERAVLRIFAEQAAEGVHG